MQARAAPCCSYRAAATESYSGFLKTIELMTTCSAVNGDAAASAMNGLPLFSTMTGDTGVAGRLPLARSLMPDALNSFIESFSTKPKPGMT